MVSKICFFTPTFKTINPSFKAQMMMLLTSWFYSSVWESLAAIIHTFLITKNPEVSSYKWVADRPRHLDIINFIIIITAQYLFTQNAPCPTLLLFAQQRSEKEIRITRRTVKTSSVSPAVKIIWARITPTEAPATVSGSGWQASYCCVSVSMSLQGRRVSCLTR